MFLTAGMATVFVTRHVWGAEMRQILAALAAGLLFGLGLILSRMIDPAKVLGFLDIAGNWDPSLALVLAGAIGHGRHRLPAHPRPAVRTAFCREF